MYDTEMQMQLVRQRHAELRRSADRGSLFTAGRGLRRRRLHADRVVDAVATGAKEVTRPSWVGIIWG